MSIKTEINRIRGNVAAAYSAAAAKGAEMPADMNSDNLAATIASISAGGTIETEVVSRDISVTAAGSPSISFQANGSGTGFFQFDVGQDDVDWMRDVAANLITGDALLTILPRTSGGTINITARVSTRVINNIPELLLNFDVGNATYGLQNNKFLGLFSLRIAKGTNYLTTTLQGFGGVAETFNASPNITFSITAVKFKSSAVAMLSDDAANINHRRVINESN